MRLNSETHCENVAPSEVGTYANVPALAGTMWGGEQDFGIHAIPPGHRGYCWGADEWICCLAK